MFMKIRENITPRGDGNSFTTLFLLFFNLKT